MDAYQACIFEPHIATRVGDGCFGFVKACRENSGLREIHRNHIFTVKYHKTLYVCSRFQVSLADSCSPHIGKEMFIRIQNCCKSSDLIQSSFDKLGLDIVKPP